MAQPQRDRARQDAAELIARSVRYAARRTPLTATIAAALKRRGAVEERLAPAFVEAAMRRAYPGTLLSELYRVQFEEAISDAVGTCLSMTLDECIALAIAQDTAETRNEPLALYVPEPEPPTPRPALDLRSVRRTLREILPESREPSPSEAKAFGRSTRGPREQVVAIDSTTPAPAPAPAPRVVPGMPEMTAAARTFLDRHVADKKFSKRGALLVYVGYIWRAAQGGTAEDDAARVQAYVAAIWPTYAAFHGLDP